MTPQELKNSILQLAIQGRLVEQRPEEGTAEELYRQIQREKAALVKAGKIKKEKPLPEITEEEVPFEIPVGWKWVRVRDCISNRAGLAYNKENLSIKTDDMVRVLRGGNIYDMGYALKDDDVLISREFVKGDLLLRHNTIITPAVTSLDHVGKMGLIEQDYSNVVVGGFVLMLSPHLDNSVFSKYLLFAFSSKYFRDCCRQIVNKSGQAFYNLSREKMMALIIPLPPLAEQRRIVAKIEELLPYIDRYEAAWSRLEDFNKRFPTDMQKSILQLAIQGKLVPQRPEEDTGEALYQQIQAEKQSLIRSGKLKKEKPLPEITPDEIPFDIPESWKWVRLNDIVDVRDGTHDTPQYVSKGYPLITGKDFYYGVFDFSKTQYISEYDYQLIIQRSRVDVGDILFSMIGGNIGSMIQITEENYFEMAIKNVALYKQYSKDLSISNYLYVYLKSQVTEFKKIAKGGAQSFVPLKLLRNFLIPLPPFAEQKRIVAKLEELLLMSERLKT